MSTSTIRNADHVEREYGQEKWPAIEQLIAEQVGLEPDPQLTRVLGRVTRAQFGPDDPLRTHPFRVRDRLVELPVSGSFRGAQGILLACLAQAATTETDLVVELGSGWAQHLLSFYVTGGPAQATYVAAEYTEAGRRASDVLAALEPRLAYRSLAFDYYAPDLSSLAGHRHAVVFSAHSIEQIDHVPPALFDEIRGVADAVSVIHFEPVGWQVDGADGGTTAAYAERHDYTRDFVPRLQAEADAGKLVVDSVDVDVFGINPRNASTVVRWHAGGGE